jgi:hypothetical protein
MKKDAHIVLFGNVSIQRSWCQNCHSFSLIVEKSFLCCDRPCLELANSYRRETNPDGIRRLPPPWWRKQQILEQDNRCFYCDRIFGTLLYRRKKGEYRLTIHWDHRIPFSLTQDNRIYNYVAACRLCNLWKSHKIFLTTEGARAFLKEKWDREEYETL